MTNHFSDNAILNLRQFVISEVSKSGLIDGITYPSEFGNKIPVVPVEQTPETNNALGTQPFVVYEFSPLGTVNTQYWINDETATFYIYSSDFIQAFSFQNLLVDLFRRFHLSAMDVNVFTETNNPDSMIKLLSVEVTSSDAPKAAKSESGRIGVSVTIQYQYIREIGSNGRYTSRVSSV